jgi:predicted transcriptional regulator
MMKRRYKKFIQKDFADLLGISQPMVCRLLSGEEKVGFPLAVTLSKLFPGKDILGWKNATAEDIKRLYRQVQIEKEAA